MVTYEKLPCAAQTVSKNSAEQFRTMWGFGEYRVACMENHVKLCSMIHIKDLAGPQASRNLLLKIRMTDGILYLVVSGIPLISVVEYFVIVSGADSRRGALLPIK